MISIDAKRNIRQAFGPVQLVLVSVLVCLVTVTGWCAPYSLELARASSNARAARRVLVAVPVHQMETHVSESAMSSIQRLKAAMEQVIIAYLRDLPVDVTSDAGKIERDLTSLLEIDVRGEDAGERYGHEVQFKVGLGQDKRRLLHVKGVVGLVCGNTDALLLVFQPENGRWREILKWQNPPYQSISGALNSFDYVVSPEDSTGQWYVLASTAPAWCSSCWGSMQYYVLRPGAQSTTPEVSFSNSAPYYRCNAGEWQEALAAAPDSFEVRFPGNSLDAVNRIRGHVRHFELRSGGITRSQPVADTPRDFVDEWIVSSNADASLWNSAGRSQKLKDQHEFLHGYDRSEGLEYGEITPLHSGSNIFQVELLRYGEDYKVPLRYFLVRQDATFTMLDVRRLPLRRGLPKH